MAADRRLGFHSLDTEVTEALPIEGTLPEWLSGSLIRNGPGTFETGAGTVDHWFDGLAMLYKFTFKDGITYQNRFLRTEAFQQAQTGAFDGGFATGDSTLRERVRGLLFGNPYDNTNIIAERIGDQYLALTETPRWVEFDPETLATRGHIAYDGSAPSGNLACAHMQHDPRTNEVVNFETEFGRTSKYHIYAMSTPSVRTHVASIPVEEPAYMHSFALTPNYVILTEFPFVINPLEFFRPGRQEAFINQFRWEPDRGTRFLVIDRRTGATVATPRTDAFFGFHHVNAYEDGETLVIDLETIPDSEAINALSMDILGKDSFDVFGGTLERFRLRIKGQESATITRTELYDGTGLPTVSPSRWTLPYRYIYAQQTDQPVLHWPQAIVKVDTETSTVQEFTSDDQYVSEPIFVPRPDGNHEDDGVVLVVTLDRTDEQSYLVVLDGETLSERARASLPHAAPFDFHGRFFPET